MSPSSIDFLGWKKDFVLEQHWPAHAETACPHCNIGFTKLHLGHTHRRSFFRERCRQRYPR